MLLSLIHVSTYKINVDTTVPKDSFAHIAIHCSSTGVPDYVYVQIPMGCVHTYMYLYKCIHLQVQ